MTMKHYDPRLFPEITHKAWAAKVSENGFYTGNAISDAGVSFFVRSFRETSSNHFTFEPGHLQDYDLNQFGNLLPGHIRSTVKQLLRDQGGVLYCVRHYAGKRREDRRVHGWILMDWHENEVLFRTWAESDKSESCMRYALSVIHHHAVWSNGVRARHCYERAMAARNPQWADA
jgi:hypothetical protein